MATLEIKNAKNAIDADVRKKALEVIDKNLTTDNLKFIATLATKPTINASLSNTIKRGILKSNV